MANAEIARDVINETSGKLHFMLTNIFGTEESADNYMKQIYAEISSTNKAPTEKDIYKKAAEICFKALGKPGNTNPTEFPIEDMRAFFESCEKFDKIVSPNSLTDIDALNGVPDSLDPISKLTVFLRMYLGMSTDEIAKSAGVNEKSIVICLFCAYRSIMPDAAKICSSIPSLMGQPILQFVRMSLLKQSANKTSTSNTPDNSSVTTVTDFTAAPESPVVKAPAAQPVSQTVAFPEINFGPMYEPPATIEMKAGQMPAFMPAPETVSHPETDFAPMFKPTIGFENSSAPAPAAVAFPEVNYSPAFDTPAVEKPTEPAPTAKAEPAFAPAVTSEPAPAAVAFPEVNYGPAFDTPAVEKPTEPAPTAKAEPAFAPAVTSEPAPAAVAFPEVNYGPAFDTPAVEKPTEPAPAAKTEPAFAPATPTPFVAADNIYNQPSTVSDSPEWEYVKKKFGFDVSDSINAKLSEAYQLISKGYTDQAKQLLFAVNREAPHAASFLGLLMIDVSAATPDDMFNISANYSSLPLFNAADYYANSQLKDFLNKLLSKNTAPTPIPTDPFSETVPMPTAQPVPAAQPMPVAQPMPTAQPAPVAQPAPKAKPTKEKKSKTGLLIGMIIAVAFLAIAGVAYYAISTGLITLPWQNDNPTEKSEVTTVDATTNASAEQPAIVRLGIGITTVTIDRSKSNRFEFRPTESGYYVFSSDETDIDLDGNLFNGTERIANDFDSGSENNFMIAAYCEEYTPLTLTVSEKVKSSGEAEVKITVYLLDDEDGKAYAKYTSYCSTGFTVTTSDFLYLDHSLDGTRVPANQDATVIPIDYYIDKAEDTLWIALPGTSKDSNNDVTLWYPVKY